jgi:hypothetical protein
MLRFLGGFDGDFWGGARSGWLQWSLTTRCHMGWIVMTTTSLILSLRCDAEAGGSVFVCSDDLEGPWAPVKEVGPVSDFDKGQLSEEQIKHRCVVGQAPARSAKGVNKT